MLPWDVHLPRLAAVEAAIAAKEGRVQGRLDTIVVETSLRCQSNVGFQACGHAALIEADGQLWTR